MNGILLPSLESVGKAHDNIGQLGNAIGMRGWNQQFKASGDTYTISSGHTCLTKLGTTWSIETSGTITSTSATDMCIDLTALFGSGNEPSTVAEFRTLFPANYYPYYKKEYLYKNLLSSTVTYGTDYTYMGCYVLIPAKHTYSLQFQTVYASGEPYGMALCYSSTALRPYETVVKTSDSAFCCVNGYTLSDITLYVWAKAAYAGSNTNQLYVNGWIESA